MMNGKKCKHPEIYSPLCIRRIFPPIDDREEDQDEDDFFFISFSNSTDGSVDDHGSLPNEYLYDEELKYHSKRRDVPQKRLVKNTANCFIAGKWKIMVKVSFIFIAFTLFCGSASRPKELKTDHHRPEGGSSNKYHGSSLRPSFTNIQQSRDLDLSIVILVSTKYELLAQLLSSIIHQKGAKFEVIIVDKKCHPLTKKILRLGFEGVSFKYKYLPLCNSPSYAIGSNKGAEAASQYSKWVMFLHDDVVLQGEDFLKNMVDIGAAKPNAGGAVCTLLSENREELVEAGGIVWNDGYVESIGRGEAFESVDYLVYSKPIDFGSGACLMLEKQLFVGSGGFEVDEREAFFADYYKDVDLQLSIQHKMGKEIWLQPNATALQTNQIYDTRTAPIAAQHFSERWGEQLMSKHLQNPRTHHDKHAKRLQIMRASDLRARDSSRANILWFEGAVPNPENGNESERAYEIMSIAAELGHKITLVIREKINVLLCNKKCRDRIASLGVELIVEPWEEYVNKYIDFFDVVHISKSATFQATYEKWQEVYEKHSFALIYDCETLWYERDLKLLSLLESNGIYNFPGGMERLGLVGSAMDMELVKLRVEGTKDLELNLIRMADSVLTVSYGDTEKIHKLLPETQIFTAGYIINVDETRIAKKTFHQRSGILFLASFDDTMYHNGDAIWYFLNEVYPLVMKESKSPIALTIAGRNIPEELYELVERNSSLKRNIIFRESVVDIDELYNNARVFIAPNLYGAGVQYKVSEAFSRGIPAVMSTYTADSVGISAKDAIGCIGRNSETLKKCIIDIYGDEETWDMMQQNGLKFIRKNHDRNDARVVLDRVINTNLEKIKSIREKGDPRKIEHGLITAKMNRVTHPCPEGEKYYAMKYIEIKEDVDSGKFGSFFEHYQLLGKDQGKEYLCWKELKKLETISAIATR